MFTTPAVSSIIREGKTQKLTDVITQGKADGMQFMDEAIWDKLRAGIVTPEEAYMKAIDKTRFKNWASSRDQDNGSQDTLLSKVTRAI